MTRAEKIEAAAKALLVLIGFGPRGIEPDVRGTYNQRVCALWVALYASPEVKPTAVEQYLPVIDAGTGQEVHRISVNGWACTACAGFVGHPNPMEACIAGPGCIGVAPATEVKPTGEGERLVKCPECQGEGRYGTGVEGDDGEVTRCCDDCEGRGTVLAPSTKEGAPRPACACGCGRALVDSDPAPYAHPCAPRPAEEAP